MPSTIPTPKPIWPIYRADYGLPPCTTANGCFTKLNQTGAAGPYPAGDPGWAEEISLDVDTVSAICPLCHITLVEANTNATSNLLAAELIAGGLNPTAISNSWGSSEFTGEHSFDGNFTFPGIPVTVSTGDSGYGTSWPASAPNVTAVGGTVLTADTSARGWSESVWNGANSGCSTKEAKPAWQTDSGCAKRTIADVSALAGLPGEAIYDTYGGDPGWEDFGGTSLASPIIASVYALAYPDSPISSTYGNHSSLFDVTSGSNGSCGGTLPVHRRVGLRRAHRAGHAVWHRRLRHRSVRDAGLLDTGADAERTAVDVEAVVDPRAGVHTGLHGRPAGLRPLRRPTHHQALNAAHIWNISSLYAVNGLGTVHRWTRKKQQRRSTS